MAMDDTRYSERAQTSRILCLDDEEPVLKSLRRLLKNVRYEVTCYTSAVEALAYLEKNDVDLIISDMRMPEMNGDKFLTKAAEIAPNTVRILLTGYADLDSTINAINDGKIHRYMQKPWDNNELLDIVASEISLKQREDERKHYEKLVKSLSTTDGLTGLLNRGAFFEQLEAQCECGTLMTGMAPSYLVLLDVDKFSAINEKVGPQTGDDVLKLVGRMMTCNLRSGDLIARIEDDEFGVLINQYTKEDCIDTVIERIRNFMTERTFLVRNHPIDLTISLAAAPIEIGSSADAVYKRASDAMSKAQAEGGDRYEIAD
ncbi:MAG TPA: diguanylate cyclase [Marinobacterium sp.]|nr:diguanylate cyclase [Marinobacterium sp.]